MAIEKVQAGQEIKADKINEIIDSIENIELEPGPKGDKGDKGIAGTNGLGVKAIALTKDGEGIITGGTATLTDDSTIEITVS